MEVTEKKNYRVRLVEELNQRKAKNPAYSLRSFARALRIPPSSLSQVLLGKRPLTLKSARRIAQALELDPNERREFIASVLPTFSDTQLPAWEGSSLHDLELDKFKLISEWYHLAILGLADLKENRFDASWVSDMLSISKKESRNALNRLKRLGIVGTRGKGFFQKIPFFKVVAPNGYAPIRHFHKSTLQLAEHSLERDGLDEREFNTITMAIDIEKLPEAKKRISKFRDELCSFLEAGQQSRVYMLSLQLFPISKSERTKK